MKRIVKIGLTLFLAYLIPSGTIIAQDKKNEQKIKIIVADKSGTKVEIDTIIKSDVPVESIKLKNGEVIFLSNHSTVGTMRHFESGNGQVFVNVSSDKKGEKGEKMIMQHVTVVGGDSAHLNHISEGGDVIIIKSGTHITEEPGAKVFTWTSSEGDSKGGRYVYINEDKDTGKGGEKTINVKVTTDEKGNKVERTKYVIAKDGMVVTVEGDDETKVNDLVKDFESKLGVKRADKEIKKVAKEEKKKTTTK